MYEYKVEIYKVKEAEKEMNAMAQQGWRVVAVTHCPDATWAVFSPWFNGMGELGGIIIGVGFFLAFEMVICTGIIISKINDSKDM